MSDALPPGFELEGASAPQQQDPGASSSQNTSAALPPGFELEGQSGVEQAKAGAEGVARGFLGPVAPAVETRILGVPAANIRAREEANPGTAALGQAAGLGAGMLTGTGEAALMEGAGHLAVDASGLGKAASAVGEFGPQVPSLVHKIGSEAVRQAAEMTVLQGGDEVAKQILNDPDASSQSAVANMGVAAALGGVFGAGGAATGALWRATAGPKVEEFLSGLQNHVDGGSKLTLPEGLQASFDELGIEPHPVMRAALSGDKDALYKAQELYRAQNREFLDHLDTLPAQVRESVSKGLGIPLEDAAVFSNAEDGTAVRDKAVDRIRDVAAPIQDALDARDAEAATIHVPDEERLDLASKIMDKAVSDSVGTDSPVYKQYEHYAQRVLAKNDIGGLDKLSTELREKATSLGTDKVEKRALFDIRDMLHEFKEQQISKQAKEIGESMVDSELVATAQRAKEVSGVGSEATRVAREAQEQAKAAQAAGRAEGKSIGAEVINRRADVNRNYAEYAKKMDQLTSHLGISDFKGTEGLIQRLKELSPEQIISKFSTKGDVEGAAYLTKEFPEVAELVRGHEAKKFLAPSVHDVMGETSLDVKNLAKRLETLKKGSPEHAAWVLPQGADAKIQAAKQINDAVSKIKGIKDSGTPGGLAKVFSHLGSGAIGAIGWVMGHNPVSGAIIGELAQRLSKDAPEAIKLATLKFMGSSEPVNAPAFKATVDFFHNVYKQDKLLNKSVDFVFKAGTVAGLAESDSGKRDKLDKIVTKYQANPNAVTQTNPGEMGHYLPNHQTATTQAAVSQLQYLQGLKPHPYRSSPLDKEIEPSTAQIARYNRALDIASAPTTVLQHVKDGTLQPSDVQDLHAMYPDYYQTMIQRLSNAMTKGHSDERHVPYHTRMGISLFLGQPIDSTMQPSSIVAAQPKSQQAPQPQGKPVPKKSGTALAKGPKAYQTASQASESDRASRD